MRRAPIALLLAVLLGTPAAADAPTDVNIVTGLDMSESVGRASLRGQLAALAEAVRGPALLAAVGRGRHGRVGFVLFAWHSRQVEVVPWTVIATADDAEAAARAIEARIAVDPAVEARAAERYFAGRLTALAAAMDHAATLFATAPSPTGRRVLNVIGNGGDNMGGAPRAGRDRLLAAGVTVNGTVVDGDDDTVAYFAEEVVGGRGAFLLRAGGTDDIGELMRRKFLEDLITTPRAAQSADAWSGTASR
jgi:Ca-activated chloride channel homolog